MSNYVVREEPEESVRLRNEATRKQREDSRFARRLEELRRGGGREYTDEQRQAAEMAGMRVHDYVRVMGEE